MTDTHVEKMLPVYEAKMIHHYDHRWATYERDGSVRDVLIEEKRHPDFVAFPRYWVSARAVRDRLAERWDRDWLLGWRDICRSTDERTTISTVDGRGASPEGGTLLALPDYRSAYEATWLVSSLNSFVFDFVARQKVGGTHLKYFTMRQLPILKPAAFLEPAPWTGPVGLGEWVTVRALELIFTAEDLTAFGADLGDSGMPFIWHEDRRMQLRAELDGAYFHLYGVDQDDVDYILDTFPIVKRKDEKEFGEYRTKRLILEVYDAMAEAMRTGSPYQTILDPPPGQGPRHPERSVNP